MHDNNHAEQAHARGLQFRKDNKPADAVEAFREAVRLRPGWADAQNNLGLSLRAVGSLDDALTAFRAALRAKCDHPEARNNLGVTLSDQGLLNEAVATYRQVLKLRPSAADTHNNLGVVLAQQGKRADATASYRRAIELRPDYAEAHNNLGNSLRHEGKLEEAEAELRTALRLKPHYAEAYNNLAIILVKQERVDEAIRLYHEALRLKPDYRDAHKNLGLALLGKGDYAAGWRGYAYRWGTKEMPARSFPAANKVSGPFSAASDASGTVAADSAEKGPDTFFAAEAPAWDGGPLEGKTILLYAEQGLGDTIQFIRFAAAVAERGARVVVECQKALQPLLSRCAGIERLVAQGAVLPPFDMQTPLMSVPGLLAVGHVSNVPAQPGELCNQPAVNGHVGNVPHGGTPYLTAEPDRIRRWATELAPFTGFKIGVSWQGSRSYQEDQFRSIPLAKFEPIARVAGTRLFSLQKGYGSEQIGALRGWRVHDFGKKLDADGAFLDTAALMMHLDLVITSDTAIAHLAGALGVQVWLALPTAPDWRWLQEREDTPWYPSMRLFRQKKRGDWDGVFARMARELETLPALESAGRYAERGLALLREGKPAEAAALFGRAIELEPRNAVFHNNRAVALDQAGKKAEALAGFEEAVRLNGEYGDARHNLGNMLRRAGRMQEAEEQYRKTLPLLRNSADLHNHLGIALLGQAKHREAEACFRRCLSLKPDHAEAHNNLGVLFEQLGRIDEAITAYQESLRLKPDAVDTHRNLALGRLMRGDYARGWADYEWRWHGKPPRFPQPRWDGKALNGETVLLHAEQGLGDTIQFVRYAPLVQARGGTVVVECPAALATLLERCPGIDRVVPQGTPLPDFAYHVPFLSLPGVFQTTLETVPANVPYLSAEPERVARWGRELSKTSEVSEDFGSLNGHGRRCEERWVARVARVARVPPVPPAESGTRI